MILRFFGIKDKRISSLLKGDIFELLNETLYLLSKL